MSRLMKCLVLFVVSLESFSFSLVAGQDTFPRLEVAIEFTKHNYFEGVKSIDIQSNRTLHLKCFGNGPMFWTFPHNYWYEGYSIAEVAQITNHCTNHGRRQSCTSEFILPETSYEQTGFFGCSYNETQFDNDKNDQNWVYVFVNDPKNLLLPYEGHEFIFMSVVQSSPTTIPCIPTSSGAQVSLIKIHTPTNKPEPIKVDDQSVKYSPIYGFSFEHPRWDAETSFLDCFAALNGQNESKSVSIHWSVEPVHIKPHIDDIEARYASINNSFSLSCIVNVDIGVLISMDWEVPRSLDETRLIKGEARSEKAGVGGSTYQVFNQKLTVVSAQAADAGQYTCKVNDAQGKIYNASYAVIISDSSLPPSIALSMDGVDTTRPLITQAGEKVQFVVTVFAIPDFRSVVMYWTKDGERITENIAASSYKLTAAAEISLDNIVDGTHYKAKFDGGQMLLMISRTDVSDSGNYTLVASNDRGTGDNISIALRVKGKPMVKVRDMRDFYKLDDNYTLTCDAIAFPLPEVQWFWYPCKEGPDVCRRPVNISDWISVNETAVEGLDNLEEVLDVTMDNVTCTSSRGLRVTARESGLYRCMAINKQGLESASEPFIVTEAIDGFSVTSSTDDPVEKEEIRLICQASQFNYTKLAWFWVPLIGNKEMVLLTNSTNVTDLLVNDEEDRHTLSSAVILAPASMQSSGIYFCNATSRRTNMPTVSKKFELIVQKIQKPIIVDTNMNGELITRQAQKKISFYCRAYGKPKPKITWLKNDRPLLESDQFSIETRNDNQELVIGRLVHTDSGHYDCVVENSGGRLVMSLKLKVVGDGDGIKPGLIVLLSVFLVIGIVFVIMAIYFGKRIRQERRQKRELEFFSANLFDQGQVEMFNPDMPLDEQVDLLPYDRRWEFPKERLKLGRTLGQGAFGRVVRAEAIGLEDDETSSTVAVKMLKERADVTQKKALMSELKIMIHLGRHLNIVNLLGAVTGGIAQGELMVMVEYCRFGNLRHFLLDRRDSYVDQINPETGLVDSTIQKRRPSFVAHPGRRSYVNEAVINGALIGASVANPTYQGTASGGATVRYVELQHARGGSQTGDGSGGAIVVFEPEADMTTGADEMTATGDIVSADVFSASYRGESGRKSGQHQKLVTTCDLICYAFQVTRGMEYLASRKLIHRDLAARNVLLAEDNIVKICDFGLAKDCYKYDNYVKKGDGPLPVKWMAIESIRDKVFTIKSDVWSFAVLCWEFFTLGGNPYPGIEIDEIFYTKLKNGYRMERPDYCPEFFYDLMRKCWDAEPKERPDFSQLSEQLGDLLEASVRQHYLDLNDPYQEMNTILFAENTDYLNMRPQSEFSQAPGSEASDYLSMSRPASNPLDHYDPVMAPRPVGNGPVPLNAMEEVPMIQLNSLSSRPSSDGDEPIYTNNNRVFPMNVETNSNSKSTTLDVRDSVIEGDEPYEPQEYLRMNGMVNFSQNVVEINKLNKNFVEITDSCHRF